MVYCFYTFSALHNADVCRTSDGTICLLNLSNNTSKNLLLLSDLANGRLLLTHITLWIVK